MCSTMVAVGTIRSEPDCDRNCSSATRDFPDAGGPEIRRFKFPLYGRTSERLLLFAGQLRRQLGAYLLEFFALARLQDLENPGQASRTQIVELVLQALIVVAVVLE